MMDPSSIRGALSARLGDCQFDGDGAFPAECNLPPSQIVKPLMYWKIAVSATRQACHDRRKICSALIVLKNVSTTE